MGIILKDAAMPFAVVLDNWNCPDYRQTAVPERGLRPEAGRRRKRTANLEDIAPFQGSIILPSFNHPASRDVNVSRPVGAYRQSMPIRFKTQENSPEGAPSIKDGRSPSEKT